MKRARSFAGTGVLLLCACAPDYDDAVTVLAASKESLEAPALEEFGFELAGAPLRRFARADQLLLAEGLANRWPPDTQRRLLADDGPEAASKRELLLLEHGTPSRTVLWRDELYFFYARGGRNAPCEVVFAVVDAGSARVLDSLDPMSEAIGVVFGAFDAAADGEVLRIVYGTPADAYGSPGALREIIGTQQGGRLDFGEPETVFEAPGRVFDVQFLEHDGGLTLLFQVGNRLACSRLEEAGDWGQPVVLSETSIPRSASCTAVGQDVVVAWVDQRYESMRGWAPINGRKLMLARSTDGGRTFGEPVLIGSKEDEDDSSIRTYLAPAGGRPVVFARREGEGSWSRFLLARDLGGYEELEPVPDAELARAYEARLRPLLTTDSPR